MKRSVLAVGLLVVVCSVAFQAQSPAPTADPINGTWKLNAARSTYSPGPGPAPTAADVRRFWAIEGGWQVALVNTTDAQGNPNFVHQVYKVDGKPYPGHSTETLTQLMAAGKQTNVTRSFRRIDPYTVEFQQYTDGVANPIKEVRTVSKDGKTYTRHITGKNAQGQAVNNVIVYDRVN